MISLTNQQKVDAIVCAIPKGDLVDFANISQQIYGNRGGGGIIGAYLATQRQRANYPYWRVTNCQGHPVAELHAIALLEAEGHKIVNGQIA